MAASLGLAHEACYAAGYSPAAAAAAAASYYSSPAAPPEFPTPGATVADDYFQFQFGFSQEMPVGARVPGGCGGYCSPPAPVFANGCSSDTAAVAAGGNGMSLLSYGGVDGDGRWPMSGPTGGNGGGGRRPPSRVGFRTRSEVDVLDDGFKWRKYGKKAVTSSPNPRNYYRCSAEGCGVKKRVERDSGDPRYVVTTYDGVHNHAAPAAAYLCHRPPPPPPRGATATTLSPPRSASASAAPLVAAPPGWSAAAACDGWEAQLHGAAAAHSSESSY